MSDTEEVILPRSSAVKKNTKPEIAREKLKEKRERLKKEKENALIEEAKKRLLAEEEAKKLAALKEEESKKADPVFQMSEQMKQMMEMWKATMMARPNMGDEDEMQTSPPPKVRKPRAKKVPEAPKPPTPPPAPKPRKPRAARKPKQIVYEEDSPSNQFVGQAPTAPPQPELREPAPQNHLLSQMMSRRNMNTWGY